MVAIPLHADVTITVDPEKGFPRPTDLFIPTFAEGRDGYVGFACSLKQAIYIFEHAPVSITVICIDVPRAEKVWNVEQASQFFDKKVSS